ncbi:MAG: metallophosphoesterase [bacterium]
MTTIFYASDLHGSEVCFKKFTNAARFYKADVLILGGDLTAKMVIPIVEFGNGIFKATLLGKKQTATNREELEDLEARINANGFYSYRCGLDELDALNSSKEKQHELFRKAIIDSLKNWIDLAEKRLVNSGVECYIMAGNDDDPAVVDVLNASPFIVNPEGRKLKVAGEYEMVSLGFSNRTPFDSPRELDESDLYEKIVEQAGLLENPQKAIFNLHCPPYDSGLDLAPKLTPDMEMVMSAGQPVMIPVGSTSVRSAIEEFQPLLGLHGHVHESRGAARIGRTLCLNPGSEYVASVLRGVIVKLAGEQIEGYQFVSG